jgi:hypothetical protein
MCSLVVDSDRLNTFVILRCKMYGIGGTEFLGTYIY